MAKNFQNCVTEAIRAGHISAEEGKQVLKWYDYIRKTGAGDAKAKGEVAERLEGIAQERQRRSLLTAVAWSREINGLESFRNAKGERDMPLAHRLQFFRRGDEGKFVGMGQDDIAGLSVAEIEYQIKSEAMRELEKVSREMRRGVFSGDLKRTSKVLAAISPGAARVQARALEVVKAMKGEATSDPVAKELAAIMKSVSNKMRLAYNEAGGQIGELADWAGPQAHNSFAVREFSQEKWAKLTFDLLDRERMVHPITKKKLSDDELIESLRVVWKTISDEGFIDEAKIEGVPTGRGALWSQHADHRFLHFKSADAWMTYAKQFGNQDPYGAFVGWISVMSRDLAAMKKFGPNPNVLIDHTQKVIEARARSFKTTEVMIAEAKDRMQALTREWSEERQARYKQMADELVALAEEIAVERRAADDMHAFSTSPELLEKVYAKTEELTRKFNQIQRDIFDPKHGENITIDDIAANDEIGRILEQMRDSVLFAKVRNPQDYARVMNKKTKTMWDLMRGATGVAVNQEFADIMATTKNYISATMLPMAVLSAIADPVFGATKRMREGASFGQWNPLTVLKDTIVHMAPEAKRYAAQSGVVFDTAINVWHRQAQEASTLAKMRAGSSFVADRVLSVSLLIPYTEAGKAGSQLWLMGKVANEVTRKWADLTPELKDMLERGGFDAKGWDTIRSAQLDEPKPGAFFLRANEIFDQSPELSRRYISMISRESAYAIIEPTPESRSFVVGNTQPGTPSGEVVRAGSMLKGFPIAVLFQWWGQLANDMRAGNHRSAASTTASLVITGMMMGALAIMIKDVAAGRDPRKMFDDETYLDGNFWMAALLQAGGLGIFGDFLFSEVNRSGGNLGQTIAGPVVDRLDTVKKLTVDNMIQLARGKNTNFGAELTKFMRQNVPTVMWNKLLMERVVWDQFQRMVDPEAQRSFDRQIGQRKREYGQDFWYAPGSTTTRAPDLSRALATRK